MKHHHLDEDLQIILFDRRPAAAAPWYRGTESDKAKVKHNHLDEDFQIRLRYLRPSCGGGPMVSGDGSQKPGKGEAPSFGRRLAYKTVGPEAFGGGPMVSGDGSRP